LRDLVAGQSRLLDQMSKKVGSNDKTLENINTRMDTFASTINNQHSFNKMIESQIAHLAAVVPLSDNVTPGFLKNKTRLIICVPRKSTHMPE
jgi:hypothetical protein